MSNSWTIIGVDCATKPEKTGLARSKLRRNGRLCVSQVMLGSAGGSATATIAGWINDCEHFLIAMDAPLGWPVPMADALSGHRAGQPLSGEANHFFRRTTDRFVHANLNKTPLDVGADRIARTAKAALSLLQHVREDSQQSIPLVWKPRRESGAIEVYPAATLLSRGVRCTGYKGNEPKHRTARKEILERLQAEVDISATLFAKISENDDLLDAVVCVLAGADFVREVALDPRNLPHPKDLEEVKREGWIWFRGVQRSERWGAPFVSGLGRTPRLIEAAFPLKETSIDSVHEKNVRHGHISTLHVWPARRPLAASRAVLLATLLDDPGGDGRKDLLKRIAGSALKTMSERGDKDATRGGILHWGRESSPELARLREEIREAFGGRAPRVLDPFAGGGAIPLEAMRLGCEVTASDINPVAWFILRCHLHYPAPDGGTDSSPTGLRLTRPLIRRGISEIARNHEEE